MYKTYIEDLFSVLLQTQLTGKKNAESENLNLLDYNKIVGSLLEIFTKIKTAKKYVFFIGNGGSSAIASHMTADFMKNGGMKTVSLYDSSLMTCMGNDYGYQDIFSGPLSFIGNEGDLLVAISSSGNSENIIRAIEAAHKSGMKVLTFTGFEPDNRARSEGDFNLWVPVCEYGLVESIHCIILQQIVDEILKRDGARL